MISAGHTEYGTDVQGYEPIRSGGGCTIGVTPGCTAAAIADLEWYLHGHNVYYVTVKVENTAGLYTMMTSQPYVHDVQMASLGVVIDTKKDVGYFHWLRNQTIKLSTQRYNIVVKIQADANVVSITL